MSFDHDHDPPPVAQLVEDLFIKLYSPSLLVLRERFESLPEAIRILILVADFDTEVSMNGLFGFLENSSGAKLPETIAALKKISANTTAETLEAVQDVLARYGITHSMLRDKLNELQPYTVASFAEVHGPMVQAALKEISALADGLYVDSPSPKEDAIDLLCHYLEPYRAELQKVTSAA